MFRCNFHQHFSTSLNAVLRDSREFQSNCQQKEDIEVDVLNIQFTVRLYRRDCFICVKLVYYGSSAENIACNAPADKRMRIRILDLYSSHAVLLDPWDDILCVGCCPTNPS
ncbi:unnamed protein product [Closterium sp. Yama58-4]|nr:unnamed protein product [Closterium sp. Yama58-4]